MGIVIILTKKEFDLLRDIYEGIVATDDLTLLKEKEYIDENSEITTSGINALNENKVDNAIILTASIERIKKRQKQNKQILLNPLKLFVLGDFLLFINKNFLTFFVLFIY